MNRSFVAFSSLAVALSSTAQNTEVVFQDDFDGPLNTNIWQPMIGDGSQFGIPGWGNNELQYYRAENAWTEDGKLIIEARRENFAGRQYTSARLRTINAVDYTYGTFEASIKLPSTPGIWPAFWMLPTNSVYGGWPRSGEIDIMESVNFADRIYGTIHFGEPQQFIGGQFADGTDFSAGFHTYRVDWTPTSIRWFIDGQLYRSFNNGSWFSSTAPDNEFAPFDQAFHMLLNVAVGGNFPGNPNGSSVFPQRMEIDYVRVSQPVQTPYLPDGNPVPGLVEAEHFDTGFPGQSYSDTSPGNGLGTFRADEDVDIEVSSENGFNVGEIVPTEWLEYTLEVAQAGRYRVDFRVASQSTGGRFRLELDGQDLTGTINTPGTGDWQNWTTISTEVDLPAGTQVVRFQNMGFAQERYNLNYMEFTLLEAECLADVNGDGELNGLDFGAWLAAFNASSPAADQNADGEVNGLDFGAWLANYSLGCD